MDRGPPPNFRDTERRGWSASPHIPARHEVRSRETAGRRAAAAAAEPSRHFSADIQSICRHLDGRAEQALDLLWSAAGGRAEPTVLAAGTGEGL